jgi:hypothetical protein
VNDRNPAWSAARLENRDRINSGHADSPFGLFEAVIDDTNTVALAAAQGSRDASLPFFGPPNDGYLTFG